MIYRVLIMHMSKRLLLLAAFFMFGTSACTASLIDEKQPPKEYVVWLEDLKKDMIKRGISKSTVKKVFAQNYYHPQPEAVKIDRKQLEFALTSTDYINRIVSKKRVEIGQKHYKELKPLLSEIEQKYGVQPEYLMAFWGAETSYGTIFGNFSTIEVLVNLSYDKRRSQFFREQLYQALKIVDTYNIDHTKMIGSWAGAMGHFQFMPSTFNAYAVDYNSDGEIDIWHSFEDAAASAANYLAQMGWDKNTPWGMRVTLPWNFDFSQTGRSQSKTIAEWQKLGVKNINKKALKLPKDIKASVIVPEGRKGNAYLLLPNFFLIMKWNRSENYALAIGTLADYFRTGKTWKKLKEDSSVRLKTDDIIKVQSFINRLGWFSLEEDGQLGSKTRHAVKEVQKKAKLPADGYPDSRLLQKINDYNRKIGFEADVKPKTDSQKLHK